MKAIASYLPFLRNRKKPTREQALTAVPFRNEYLRWFKEDGEAKVFIPRKRGAWSDFIARFFRLPDEKQIVLDKVGSGVWELCDGMHTVENILDFIQRRHKLSRREAEVSVSAYLKILSQRGLIGVKSSQTKQKEKCRIKSQK